MLSIFTLENFNTVFSRLNTVFVRLIEVLGILYKITFNYSCIKFFNLLKNNVLANKVVSFYLIKQLSSF